MRMIFPNSKTPIYAKFFATLELLKKYPDKLMTNKRKDM